MPPQRDAYASIRQRAARALLESTTLDGAVAEILGTISNELDWPLAIYWIAGADDRRLHCRSIWAAETLKRADVVEASRIAIVAADAEDDPVGRAYGRREPVWIEHLASAGAAAGTRLALAIDAGLESSAAFPIADHAGAVGAIELYAPRARPADDAMLALMAEVGHEICEVFRRQEAQATALEDVSRSRDELDLVLGGDPGRDHGPRRRRAHHLRERRRRAHLRLRVGRRDAARIRRRYRAALPDVGRGPASGSRPRSCPAAWRCAASARASCSATGRTTASWTAGSRWKSVPITDDRGRVRARRQRHPRRDQAARRRGRQRPPGRRGAGGAARARGSPGDRLARSAQPARRRARLDRPPAQEPTCRPTSRSGRAVRSRRSSAPATA